MDTDKLTAEVAEMLKIPQISEKDKPDFEIPLKNYAVYYEDDDIIKHSLIRGIKNKIESDLCGNISRIYKIKIRQNGKDLVVEVFL